MAHQLTTREDGYVEHAFVGEVPWHGLGQQLDANADMETWRKAAGMDWTIEQTECQFTPASGNTTIIPERFVQYRSDNNLPLSVVSARYKPVQPAQVLDFFNDLVAENGFRLHTAGTLFGGKRLWALAETGKFGEVSKGDNVGGYLLLSTSCDRSLATTARFTTIRVVCNNTLSFATKNNENMVSFNHLTEFNHEIIKAKLGSAVESFGAFMDVAKELKKQKITTAYAAEFVKKLVLTNAQLRDDNYDFTKNRGYRKIMDLFQLEAVGIEYAGQTKWGMLNAVTEYFDHHHPARTPDARLNNTWFGGGDSMKSDALRLLTA
jgi:phage/plasmid-like protein (TIGR03299 family)